MFSSVRTPITKLLKEIDHKPVERDVGAMVATSRKTPRPKIKSHFQYIAKKVDATWITLFPPHSILFFSCCQGLWLEVLLHLLHLVSGGSPLLTLWPCFSTCLDRSCCCKHHHNHLHLEHCHELFTFLSKAKKKAFYLFVQSKCDRKSICRGSRGRGFDTQGGPSVWSLCLSSCWSWSWW